MKVTTFIESLSELELAAKSNIEEVIFGQKEFSRLGKLSEQELVVLAKEASLRNVHSVFEWDILMTENDFKPISNELEKIDFTLFKAIRVQDPGAIYFAMNTVIIKYPHLKIQLILETGNHNTLGISKWVEYLGESLDRIVLSIELPKDKLKELIQCVSAPVEVLGLGRILLFYTPRNLLSPLYEDHDDDKNKVITSSHYIEATGESEESPHKGFPLIENRHGTFMFNIKDHFLIENIDELKEMNLAFMRVDLRQRDFSQLPRITELAQNFTKDASKEFRSNYPVSVIRGFYSVNKSDILFKKLKNSRTQRQDEDFIGHVIEVIKDKQLTILIKKRGQEIQCSQKLKIITPEGKIKLLKITRLLSSTLEPKDSIGHGQLAVINYMKGVVAKSIVYAD
ncbi:MAG: putative protease [Thermoproteota archaeon]|jgi:putative protease